MGISIKNRIFGDDILPKIKQKLEYRQAYARSANPGESLTAIDEKYGQKLKYKSNFPEDGKIVHADLSSCCVICRTWYS